MKKKIPISIWNPEQDFYKIYFSSRGTWARLSYLSIVIHYLLLISVTMQKGILRYNNAKVCQF